MSNRRVLVLTREHPPWDADDHVVFLGPWCLAKPHEGIPGGLHPAESFSLLPFHWNDRAKLREDYDYLDGLHAKLLSSLAEALNRLHGTDHSQRYWQILLDPWLMAYVGVMFDRWETMRFAMAEGWDYTAATSGGQGKRRDFSYSDFSSRIMTDAGNGQIWEDILRSEYPDRVSFFKAPRSGATASEAQAGSVTTIYSPAKLAGQIASWIGPFLDRLTPRSRFVFHQTMFDPLSLARLSLSLGQFPVFFHPSLQFEHPGILLKERSGESLRDVRFSFSPETPFESYLAARIADDIPSCVAGHFQDLECRAKRIPLRPKVILTAQSHWMNPLAKAWMAGLVEEGAELVILEHGGSFPAFKELFNFEEDIADRKGTWFLPYHEKHFQVPPPKLLRYRKRPKRDRFDAGQHCLIIGGEDPRYVYRVVFYPMADQGLRSVTMVNALFDCLSQEVRDAAMIRPYPTSFGWDTKSLYGEAHGRNKLAPQKTLPQAFASARIIVCTYPETTFTEAMVTGRPTILIYDPELNERHPATLELIGMLREAQIIFYEATEAATHINRIWTDPRKWWDSPEVTAARRAFEVQACRIHGDWLEEWKAFLLKTRDKASK